MRTGTADRLPRRHPTGNEDPRAGGDGLAELQEQLACPGKTPARAGTAIAGEAHEVQVAEDPRAGGDGGVRADIVDRGWGKTPRAGGDGHTRRSPVCSTKGRPPRGRGRPPTQFPCCSLGRKTPARAGTADQSYSRRLSDGEDPRTGGDGQRPKPDLMQQEGRPPRGRGRRQRSCYPRSCMGKTPARAGTARRGPPRAWSWREDPRAGGDGVSMYAMSSWRVGRPPRGRGRLNQERRA